MKKYENIILNKFQTFDINSKNEAITSFKKLWNNENVYNKHIQKRLQMGHIKNEIDYVAKTLKCLAEAKECLIAIYEDENIWNRIRYFDNDEWLVIFSENGTLLTSHKKEEVEISFEDKHKKFGAKIKKGDISDEFKRFFRKLRNEFRIF